MIIHHLNCATLCPLCERLINGSGSFFKRGRMVCHCLLVETTQGLVLIDTGIGQHDIDHPGRLGRLFNFMTQPRYAPSETALAQVKALGFKPEDVRHIIATHLDLDHAGGIADFPNATVHAHTIEYQTAQERKITNAKQRYLPRQWDRVSKWELYEETGEPWFGFDAVRSLNGLPEDILLVPLFGHSPGHCGIALNLGDRWLMHCGDAYFHHAQIHPQKASCPAGIKLFTRSAQWNGPLRLKNQHRLLNLAAQHSDQVSLFCAHDPVEFDAFSGTMGIGPDAKTHSA